MMGILQFQIGSKKKNITYNLYGKLFFLFLDVISH